MDAKLINYFKSLDNDIKTSLAKESSPLRLGLIILSITQTELQIDYLSSETISLCLENSGVLVKPKSITNAFSRAGDKISRKPKNNITEYKIMTKGVNEVAYFFSERGKTKIILINKSEPFTSSIKVGDLLRKLKGEIKICDPYLGSRTFSILSNIQKSSVIRFLTVHIKENQNKIKTTHKDFLKEYPNFQLRVFPNKNEIHDRYILSNGKLMIIGHGLKDIGNKESFLLVLEKSDFLDIHKILSENFENRWRKSNQFK